MGISFNSTNNRESDGNLMHFFSFLCRNPNWWPRRSSLEKSLIVISILALIGIVALVISLSGVLVKIKECESKHLIYIFFNFSNHV